VYKQINLVLVLVSDLDMFISRNRGYPRVQSYNMVRNRTMPGLAGLHACAWCLAWSGRDGNGFCHKKMARGWQFLVSFIFFRGSLVPDKSGYIFQCNHGDVTKQR